MRTSLCILANAWITSPFEIAHQRNDVEISNIPHHILGRVPFFMILFKENVINIVHDKMRSQN